jgi:hypothetical protein
MEKYANIGSLLCTQVERLLDVCNIAQEDRINPAFWMPQDGQCKVDFYVYDCDVDLNKELWGLLALTAINIQTETAYKMKEERAFIKYTVTYAI